MKSEALPRVAGTYVLVFRPAEPLVLAVGRLGQVKLTPGAYVYAGSAAGPGGLRARVARHLRSGKPRHWHIDYVTEVLSVDRVLFIACDSRLECAAVRRVLTLPGAAPAAVGFGSSDCRAHCPAHLVRLPDESGDTLAVLGPEWSLLDDACDDDG